MKSKAAPKPKKRTRSQKANPGGRPTKMTPDTVKKLEEAFLMGCPDEEACFYAGISMQTLYTYQNKTPGFLERKERMKQRPFFMARRTITTNLETNPDVAIKYMERKKKEEFGTARADVEIVNVIQMETIVLGGKQINFDIGGK